MCRISSLLLFLRPCDEQFFHCLFLVIELIYWVSNSKRIYKDVKSLTRVMANEITLYVSNSAISIKQYHC